MISEMYHEKYYDTTEHKQFYLQQTRSLAIKIAEVLRKTFIGDDFFNNYCLGTNKQQRTDFRSDVVANLESAISATEKYKSRVNSKSTIGKEDAIRAIEDAINDAAIKNNIITSGGTISNVSSNLQEREGTHLNFLSATKVQDHITNRQEEKEKEYVSLTALSFQNRL